MSETIKQCPFCGEEVLTIAKKCKHCGEWFEEQGEVEKKGDTALIRAFSSKYEIIDEAGRGGMAVVYKARQLRPNRFVALKVIPRELTHDKEFIARFHREADSAAGLKHPNIITIFEEGELSGYPYIAMEYVDGGTLSDYIKNKGVLAEDEVKGIIIPILEALEYAHRTGIVHRDIKSTNILLESGGRPVLMDFGIAKSREGTKLTMAGTVIGTPEYMSPEQAKGQAEIDHRTDIYSIGVVMYEMVTGSVPYKGDTTLSVLHQVVNSRPVNPEDLNRNVSKVFSRIILKAMSKNPSDRYQNGSAFLADFCISEKAAPEKTMNLNEGQKALERETVVIAEKDKDSLKTRKISEDVKEAKEYRKTVKHQKKLGLKVYMGILGLILFLIGGFALYNYQKELTQRREYELRMELDRKNKFAEEQKKKMEAEKLEAEEQRKKVKDEELKRKKLEDELARLKEEKESEEKIREQEEKLKAVLQKKQEEQKRAEEEQQRLLSIKKASEEKKQEEARQNEQKKNNIGMVFVKGGTFEMGDQFGDGDQDEKPVHTVTVSDFYLGVAEVTNSQFCEFLNENGNQKAGGVFWLDIESSYCLIVMEGGRYVPRSGYADHPVVEVTWYGAKAFCEWAGGRLPTEAEWEYAARNRGDNVKYPNSNTISHEDANYAGTGGKDRWDKTSPVKSFSSNRLGLYDMAGNVWEWCSDWYGNYGSNSENNPRGPSSGGSRVVRGGSWYVDARYVRCSFRCYVTPGDSGGDLGFRLCKDR